MGSNLYKLLNKLALIILLSLLSSLVANSAFAAGTQVANYLGTGSNPRLYVSLSANALKWKPYSIDYQQMGGIPCGSNPSDNNWSSWDVKDEAGNYYGTVNLVCNGYSATMTGYSAGTSANYLEGVNFEFNHAIDAYQLTVTRIHSSSSGAGPFADAPMATPAVDASTKTPITFSVSGPRIVNQKGETVILKGVVRPSLEWNPQGQFLSVTDIQNMKKWGANVVRLDLNQNYWFASGPVTQKGSYKQIINAIVYYAIQNNMAVILDLHWVKSGGQSPMANKESVRFWKEVATDYQTFGTVIFELYNEPDSISPEVWLRGDANYSGYQSMYDAIRSTGAKNLCIVNGLDYGYDLSFVDRNLSVKGFNIVYGSHPYNEKGNTNYTGPGRDFAYNFKNIVGQYPLIFTEFGVNQSSYFPSGYQDVYNRAIMYANQQSVSYTAFAWWVDPDKANANIFPDVISDWSGTPMNGGKMIHDDIQAHPGTGI